MSAKLPALTGPEVIQALERSGFAVVRIRGSHHFLRHPDGRTTMVPVLEESFAPSALEPIGEWIAARTKAGGK